MLDVGCGEGWLARAIAHPSRDVVGIDGSVALIEQARALPMPGVRFAAVSYEQCIAGAEADEHELAGMWNLIVCNFALLEEPLTPTLNALHGLLAENGRLLIQTLHPWRACNDASYRDGWRVETFAGFGEGFAQPMPWFFRTLESWLALFSETGWRLQWLQEPLHPESEQPVSLLMLLSSERS